MPHQSVPLITSVDTEDLYCPTGSQPDRLSVQVQLYQLLNNGMFWRSCTSSSKRSRVIGNTHSKICHFIDQARMTTEAIYIKHGREGGIIPLSACMWICPLRISRNKLTVHVLVSQTSLLEEKLNMESRIWKIIYKGARFK